ncbi:DUF3025 domain-containing protein [Arenimonas oryziterrae]|uniref:DUF3025 domain-containing protein n=1 Tax=Arenimonas oryziterrae DSM 21050 = YC6267 TaxID=1121015 RepID=A0A091AWI6_9GAMM|nr:DUF3025 domain-containing protein [Arenimonas oryziterrae]KFN43647.1 hypothetical protein N789_10245 [Arenimonas oryziterrae DSM 21050 = YC6267]
MRFLAPERGTLRADTFSQPVFDEHRAARELLAQDAWPTIAALDAQVQPLTHRVTGRALRLVEQTLDDAPLPYEQRIHEHGEIPTRAENWHDLFNALAWRNYPAIKSALNVRQVADIARVGTQQRTRAQDALTQFDEGGAVLLLRDRRLLPLWDAHDWEGLFLRERAAWHDGRLVLAVIGHALPEHALHPQMLLVAKTLVLFDDDGAAGDVRAAIDARIAEAILASACLLDPQELRPLPLSGIPGWHREIQDEAFYRTQPCFRPLRAGRRYPEPLSWHTTV